MARVACVDLPALPLQRLLRERPSWRESATVVVRDDRPQGEILWVNALARECRIVPGMTFAAARNLAADLRAGVISPDQIEEIVAEAFGLLCGFSPAVEPSPHAPGVFWLDPTGLTTLYGSLHQWAQMVRTVLASRELEASVVVGFHRYRSHAIARCRPGVTVLPTPRHEARLAAGLPLAHLDISPALRDGLAVLDIHLVGDLARVSPEQLKLRFGTEAESLRRRLADEHWSPLMPRRPAEPIQSEVQFDPPDHDRARILFAFRRCLQPLLRTLAGKSLAMSALHWTLQLERSQKHCESLTPAKPTLDGMTVVELVRLRLESINLPADIESMTIEVEGVPADRKQLALFATRQKRDLEAANRALARVRALLGESAVARARIGAAHLPEANVFWEPVTSICFPNVAPVVTGEPPLVRTLLTRPLPLPSPHPHEGESWLQNTLPVGVVDRMSGPFRISGGWWVKFVERDYYYAETRTGHLLWLFYDRPRRRWFLHGFVE